jgi:hypothetical protein
MSNMITMNHFEWKVNGLYISTDNKEIDLKTVTAAGRVLADSDRLSFIYILESKQEYIYVAIPSEYWIEFKKVLDQSTTVTLKILEDSIELEGIVEELNYLISNIEGNANYGEEMVEKVESIFIK